MATNLSTSLRVATLNVRGLSTRRRQLQLNRILLENEIDVLAVQESKMESEQQTDKMAEIYRSRYSVCVCHAVGRSGGCVIFIRNCIECVQSVFSCESGRLLICDFSFSGLDWRVICVYAPTRTFEREEFFHYMKSFLIHERRVLLLGDFNCVCRPEDRTTDRVLRDKSAELLIDIVNEAELEDAGCIMTHEGQAKFTHFQGSCHARLDRIYVPIDCVPLCSEYQTLPMSFSDHSLVMITLGMKSKATKFNWELWKFNEKLLLDEEFTTKVKEYIKHMLQNDSNFIQAWEQFKCEIKIAAIDRACTLRRKEREQEKELRSTLEYMLSMESVKPGLFAQDIKKIKTKLEVIDEEKYRGAVIRARSEKLWLGETPTKRALSDEKRYAVSKEIKEICYQNVVTSEKKKTIERAFVEFYSELFSLKTPDIERFRKDFLSLMPRVEDEVAQTLEASITSEEIEAVIGELNSNKSPGPDGLGAAIYKAFPTEMAVLLERVISECYEKNVPPPSFRMSHVVLIPKTDDPVKLQSVASYRPISLTNVDYKIYMKVLGRRLQRVITSLVGPHQTCGIKGRTIFTNIHAARSVLECCDAMHDHVAMMQLDLHKAFDKVVHEILFSVLEYVNAGSVITKGVKMVYECCSARLVVNKQLTDRIPVQSSVRQGCPLSPLLFALYLEPFCLRLLTRPNIRGYRFFQSEVRVLAYADDIAVFCTDHESVQEVVKEATAFCTASGSEISWAKCLGFWHGNWQYAPELFSSMQWTITPGNYLGVPLKHYRESKECWAGEVEQVKTQTNKWGGHNFSMFARATVCNMFLVAKIFYMLQVLSMSRISVQKLHRVFATFVWASTWERTSRCNLFHTVHNGGLGLSHLYLKQIVTRFFFLREQSDVFLRTVIQVRLRDSLPEYVVSTMSTGTMALSAFLREVVASFQIVKARFSNEYMCTVTRKRLYKDLLETFLPVPLYRAVYALGPERDVLKRVKRMPIRSSAKSFFFQLHTGTLPVKPWLESKGLFVPWSADCLICKKLETIEHIFLDCHDAVFLWDVLQRTIKKDLPITPFGIRYLPCAQPGEVPSDLLMVLCMHSIWRTRMDVRHEHVVVHPAHQYFVESVMYTRDVFGGQSEPPEWLPVLDKLMSPYPFYHKKPVRK